MSDLKSHGSWESLVLTHLVRDLDLTLNCVCILTKESPNKNSSFTIIKGLFLYFLLRRYYHRRLVEVLVCFSV